MACCQLLSVCWPLAGAYIHTRPLNWIFPIFLNEKMTNLEHHASASSRGPKPILTTKNASSLFLASPTTAKGNFDLMGKFHCETRLFYVSRRLLFFFFDSRRERLACLLCSCV
ncbi:hypothetical protein EDB87DRAFT_1614639 [Lactarius vividus]|nr:hypothetical protein EDB87DRAFT_1614639 [Lactarius vividus]